MTALNDPMLQKKTVLVSVGVEVVVGINDEDVAYAVASDVVSKAVQHATGNWTGTITWISPIV